MGTKIERDVTHATGAHAVRISNAEVELLVATDIGPRVLGYRHHGLRNVFGWLDPAAQAKPTSFGEPWHIYGGHRLWHAPEHAELSYVPDNRPVPFRVEDDGSLVVGGEVEQATALRKELRIRLDDEGSRVRVEHVITNAGPAAVDIAVWALSVMAPGGTAFFPTAPFVPFPDALLPSSRLVLWPYSSLADPRFTFGPRFLRLRHDAGAEAPQKVGLLDAHHGWAAYALEGRLFVKRFAPAALGARHVDLGCNVESFTDHAILELETLGPEVHLAPGASTTHVEEWFLFADLPVSGDESEVASAITSALAHAEMARH